MRLSILLCAALAILASATAWADGGQLFLSWDDCPQGGGLSDAVAICQTNDGANSLVCAFTVDQTVDDVIGIEVTVDVQGSQQTLASWWQMQQGQCRDGALRASSEFPPSAGCTDPWRHLGAGEAIDYYPGHDHSDQARLVGTYAIRSDSARVLAAGIPYYGLTLLIGNQRSVFPGECAGCQQPACLVLNSIKLLRGPKSVPTEITLETPGPGSANVALWNHATGASCSAVPVRAATWGRIKLLYR